MKIVHLNTYDGNGGAGRAVLRLNHALNDLGLNSEVVTLYKFSQNEEINTYATSVFKKLRAIFNILCERFLIRLFIKDKSVPFSLQRFGVSPMSFKQLESADIIHIHWINHGMFSPLDISTFSAFKNKKIFWTLHDSNALTGGCHVRYNCSHYLNECGNCPVLKGNSPHDLSNRTWKLKNAAYQKINFHIIAPSNWMRLCAEKASLTKEKKSSFIANALDTDFFRPKNKAACRSDLGISENCFVILAGYMPSKADRHKGFRQLKEAIAHLAQLNDLKKEDFLLLFYGGDHVDEDDQIEIPHRFLGKISDDNILVNLYNAADVFLFPSLEESMGYTALESLSCGTPVVAFNTSGVTDVVQHKDNGYLAELYNSKALAEGIMWVMNEADKDFLSANARDWAVTQFSLKVIAKKHYNLYRGL